MSKTADILIMENNVSFSLYLKKRLSDLGYSVNIAANENDCLMTLRQNVFMVVFLCDSILLNSKISTFIHSIKKNYSWIEIIILSESLNFKDAFEILNAGAFEYLIKSVSINELSSKVQSAFMKAENSYTRILQKEGTENITEVRFVSKSAAMVPVLNMVNRFARSECPVIITGETGVGKELIARMIHQKSRRKNNAFIAINCAAIPDTLLENELFGHDREAYTDAVNFKKGILDEADSGTFFLDEISELSIAAQSKLLRVLDSCRFRRLGGGSDIQVNVRFISATNKDLLQCVKKERFTKDLYYRIAVGEINIPSLRERREDIIPLAEYFLKKTRPFVKKLSSYAEKLLLNYDWPGNVRELKNIIERVIVISETKFITQSDILRVGLDLSRLRKFSDFEFFVENINEAELHSLKDIRKKYIESILSLTGGNKEKTARILGVSSRTIYNIARELH